MNKTFLILISLLLFTQLSHSQKKCDSNNYVELSASTRKRLKDLKLEATYGHSQNGYVVINNANNKFVDTLGNSTTLELPSKSIILKSPNRKKTVFVGKKIEKGLEYTQYELSIYDFNSKLIKHFDYNQIKYLQNFGYTSEQYILEDEDYLKVFSNNLSGLIDAMGNFILEPKYNAIDHIYKNYFILKNNGLRTLFDIKNNTFTKLDFDDYITTKKLGDNNNCTGKMIIIKDGKYGLFDIANQKVIVEPTFYNIEYIPITTYNFLDNYYYHISKNGYYGVIDHNGKIIIPALYKKFNFFDPNENKILTGGSDNKEYFYSYKKNKVLEQLKYDQIQELDSLVLLSDYSNNVTIFYDPETSKTIKTVNKKFLEKRLPEDQGDFYLNKFDDNSFYVLVTNKKAFIDIKTVTPVLTIKTVLNNNLVIFENTDNTFSFYDTNTKTLLYESVKSYQNVFNSVAKPENKYIGLQNDIDSCSIVDDLGNTIVKPFKSQAKYIAFENDHFLFYSDKNKTTLINVFDVNGNSVNLFTYKVSLLKKSK